MKCIPETVQFVSVMFVCLCLMTHGRRVYSIIRSLINGMFHVLFFVFLFLYLVFLLLCKSFFYISYVFTA